MTYMNEPDHIKQAADLLAKLDISRRHVERAIAAGNYRSASVLASEMASEATALSNMTDMMGRYRTRYGKGKSK